MRRWRHNWELKTLAVLLALFLWWMVHHKDSRRPAPSGKSAPAAVKR